MAPTSRARREITRWCWEEKLSWGLFQRKLVRNRLNEEKPLVGNSLLCSVGSCGGCSTLWCRMPLLGRILLFQFVPGWRCGWCPCLPRWH